MRKDGVCEHRRHRQPADVNPRQVDARLAIAAVSVPHVIGTALRFWLLKGGVDRKVLGSFGLTNAAGGLAGAALQGWLGNRWLNVVFGGLAP